MAKKRSRIAELHILRAIAACLLGVFVHVSTTYYYQQGQ
jgi:probable poly-beta-1,6-N-acetyl-D-glucosamine export protein